MKATETIETNRPVTLTLLGDQEVTFPGNLAELSGRSACIGSDRHLPPGSLLKIETGDSLLLGEVAWSQPKGTAFQAGLVLEHALHATQDLAALSRRLLGESTPERERR